MPASQGFWGRQKDVMKETYKGFQHFTNTTQVGRAFKEGVMESFGWAYGKKGRDLGFMGLNRGRGYMSGITGTKRLARMHGKLPIAGKLASRLFLPAFTAFEMYGGYKEGGVWGAAKAGAQSALLWGAMKAAGSVLLTGGTLALGAVAAGGVGAYYFQKEARQYGKKLSTLEMVSPPVDLYGTMSTSRRRSMEAMNNTYINYRMALGNEGQTLHRNIYR